jgi:uncharacterized protein YbjT (DUF2867 family)
MTIAVTTPTGQTGHHLVDALLAAGQPVRVLVRDPATLPKPVVNGCEVVTGNIQDPAAMRKLTEGASHLFFCIPMPGHAPDARAFYLHTAGVALRCAIESGVPRIVTVSSIGFGNSRNGGTVGFLHEMEEVLNASSAHIRHMRCCNIMENYVMQRKLIAHRGLMTFPMPATLAVPTIARRDVAARALPFLTSQDWTGKEGTPMHGPGDFDNLVTAEILGKAIGKPVKFEPITYDNYRSLMVNTGAMSESFADALVDMFKALNAGCFDSEPRSAESTGGMSFEDWAIETFKPAIEAEWSSKQ